MNPKQKPRSNIIYGITACFSSVRTYRNVPRIRRTFLTDFRAQKPRKIYAEQCGT